MPLLFLHGLRLGLALLGSRLVGFFGDGGGFFLDAAKRELFEETGYEAAEMRIVFNGPSSAGLSDETITFLLATGLQKTGPGGGDGHESIILHVVPLAEAWSFLERKQLAGSLVDSRVPTCLYLLEHLL